jgi:sec-independent protein translocase protein TatA
MSGGELVLVVLAVLILFGARKIPEFAKGLGQGIKEFKKASSEDTSTPPTTSNSSNKPTTPAA